MHIAIVMILGSFLLSIYSAKTALNVARIDAFRFAINVFNHQVTLAAPRPILMDLM